MSTIGVAVGLLLAATAVRAGPPAPRGFEVGGRVAANANDQGTLVLAGLRVGGRVVPHLGLGGYVDGTPWFSAIVPKCSGCGPRPERPYRVGAYVDLHLLPTRVVDPWLRAAIGYVRTARSSADAEFAAGLDVRHRRLALGPFVMWIVPTDAAQPRRWFGAGVQMSLAL